MQQNHQYYIRQCLKLAEIALAAGDPPVGAMVVLDGKVIGSGIECGCTTGDVTNHAEILAIKDALKNGFTNQLNLATLYTTHEPCAMCSYMIRHYKIPEIVYGVAVVTLGGATSRFDLLIAEDVKKWGNKPNVISGVCSAECEQLNEVFASLSNQS